MQKDGDIDSESVGPPLPGVEIRISDKGEVLYKSPGNFLGYYKNPEATAETLEDGWLHSGDAGYMTDRGHLKIIDRAKDVSRLTDGTMFAPKYIENKLKFSPYIKEAVAHGMGTRPRGRLYRHRLRRRGQLGRETPHRLHQLHGPGPETRGLRPDLRGNRQGQQEPERGRQAQELADQALSCCCTRNSTRMTARSPGPERCGRRFVAEKYGTLIEALYSPGQESVHVEAQITYEDGRTTTMKANLRLRDVETF